MINENQLRLGNLVSAKGCIQVVTEIWEGGFSYEPLFGECADDKIEGNNPIPLTEEWLLKFGFKQHITIDEDEEERTHYVLKFIKEGKELEFIVLDDYNSNNFTLADIDLRVEIPFVHQLQNLYFALTGEELELKQEVKLS